MTDFRNNPVIKREAPNAVIYDLTEPHQVTITLPASSTWSSGLHWHRHHVEYLRVVKGSIQVTLDRQVRRISASDSETEVRVERNVWHEWKRADVQDNEDVVVVERTDPDDGEKAVFFWNLNGVILKAQGLKCPPYMPKLLHGLLLDAWVTLSLFAIFRVLDNVPVFVNVLQAFSKRGFVFAEKTLGHTALRAVDVFISRILLLVASATSLLFGIKAVREEFTPDEVRRNWLASRTERGRSKKA
jgi:mannose-6-phosphate isomerase-like protein (cupin superfamily)